MLWFDLNMKINDDVVHNENMYKKEIPYARDFFNWNDTSYTHDDFFYRYELI